MAWQASSSLGWLPVRFLPPPFNVGRAALRLAASGELARHVSISTRRAALGFAFGGAIGLSLGLLNGLSETAERLFDSSLQMVRVVAIDRGTIAFAISIPLPRPRRRDSPPFAALAHEILTHVLRSPLPADA
jgi:hypothetical protein